MKKADLSAIDLIDQSNNFKFKLMFMESAIRSMIQMGNMTESRIGDGLSSFMCSLVSEFENFQQEFSHLILDDDNSTASTQSGLVDPDGKDEET